MADTGTTTRKTATEETAAPSTDAPGTAAPSTNLPATTTSGRKKTATDRDNCPASGEHHRHAANRAVAANTSHIDFHLGDTAIHLELPPVDKLAFYAGLTGAAVLGVIEWPIALLTGIGHLLTDDRRNRTLRALGEALDAA